MKLPNATRMLNSFIISAVVILCSTAFLKIATGLGESGVLSQQDPVFSFLTVRQVVLLAAGLEMGVVWSLLFGKLQSTTTKLFWILWLSVVFGTYRILLSLAGISTCDCLGKVLPFEPSTTRAISISLLVYLFSGSFLSLLFMLNLRRGTTSAPRTS